MTAQRFKSWGRGRRKSALKSFRRSEGGNVAMLFAISSVAVVGAAGAAMDYTVYSSASSLAQASADSLALNAAIYVSKHGGPPQNNKELDAKGAIQAGEYKFEDLGIDFDNGLRDARFTVEYGEEAATITVMGQTRTTLARVLGRETMNFETKSVVAYRDEIIDEVASVMLILDSSGSMSFDDLPGTITPGFEWEIEDENNSSAQFDRNPVAFTPDPDADRRLDGLRSAVNTFDQALDGIVGHQSISGRRILRVGLLAFNDRVLTRPFVLPEWKTLNEYTLSGGINPLDELTPNGATNSAPPVQRAEQLLDGEDEIHQAANQQDPHKFVVLMTDGHNTSGVSQFFADDGYYTIRISRTTARGHSTCFDGILGDGNCGVTGRFGNRTEEITSQPFDYTIESSRRPGNFPINSVTPWQRVSGDLYEQFTILGNWRQGRFQNTNDRDTIEACERMKTEQNVTIFTIGFALQEGYYESQDRTQSEQQWVLQTDENSRTRAFSMLQECASTPGHFIPADDITALNDAFRSVGQAIVTEVVRIRPS